MTASRIPSCQLQGPAVAVSVLLLHLALRAALDTLLSRLCGKRDEQANFRRQQQAGNLDAQIRLYVSTYECGIWLSPALDMLHR